MSNHIHDHTNLTCENCDSDGPLYLHSVCHPTTPTWAIMHADRLQIVCAECGAEVATYGQESAGPES